MKTINVLHVFSLLVAVCLAGPGVSFAAQDAAVVKDAQKPGPQVLDEAFAGWTLQLTRTAGVMGRAQFTNALRTAYSFWGKDWQWQYVKISNTDTVGKVAKFLVTIEDAGVAIEGKVTTHAEGMTFDYDITTTKSLAGAVGGGVEFFLTKSVEHAAPELAVDGRGFRWPTTNGTDLRVSFSAPLADLYFERGDKEHIRCMLVGPKTKIGRMHTTMSVRLPQGGRVVASLDGRYPTAADTWMPQTLSSNKSPVDLSFLNANDRPAGSRGRLRAAGDQIVDGQGRPVRLWGTNITGYALFNETTVNICATAKRLAALGFNLVRLHHHDAAWVSPNVFDMDAGTTRKLRGQSLVALDTWVKCLNDEGIYVWLDLHVGRVFLPKDDIKAGNEIAGDQTLARAYGFVNPQIERLMHEFANQYLNRNNVLTGRRYTDNAGVFAVQVLNETDLSTHFGPTLYPGGGHPVHEALFSELVTETSARLGLGKISTKDTWAPGAGKHVVSEIESGFFARAVSNLRRIGYKSLVAVAPTWGGANFALLPPITRGDLVDVHAYGEEEDLSRNPRFSAGVLPWIAGARLGGYPLTVSEWGVDGELIRDRFTLPLHFAAVASLQGWNATMHFAYQQGPMGPAGRRDRWESSEDPSLMAMMPASALIFRRGDVSLARRVFTIPLSDEMLYSGTTAGQSRAVRTLTEQSRLVLQLPKSPPPKGKPAMAKDKPAAGGETVTDLDKDYLNDGTPVVVSDTGELRRDFGAGFHTVDTPLSQAAAGWLGGRKITLSTVQMQIQTPKAAVALSSLDGLPLRDSRKILLSMVAQAEPLRDGNLPYVAEPVQGQVCLKAGPSSLSYRIVGASAGGGVTKVLAVTDGLSCLQLPVPGGHFLMIERTNGK